MQEVAKEIVAEMEAEKVEEMKNHRQKDKGLCNHEISVEDQTPQFIAVYLNLVLNYILELCNTWSFGKTRVGLQASG